MSPLDYLVIAPHPDDAELGVGGTILLLKAQGARVGVLDLTDGEPTPHGSPETRRRETDEATAMLGLDWRDNLGLANRSLVADLEARRRLASVLRQVRPRYLFAPYWEDAHPDHVAASALVDAARFWAKLTKTDMPGEPHFPKRILYYFTVHLRLHPRPSFVLDITPHIEGKMRAIACYRSQFIEGRPATPPTLLDRPSRPGPLLGLGHRYGLRRTICVPGRDRPARPVRPGLNVAARQSGPGGGERPVALSPFVLCRAAFPIGPIPTWPISPFGDAGYGRPLGRGVQRGARMAREFNVLALVKGKERYVFVYDDASHRELVDVFRDQAADPGLSFSWFDAAIMTDKAQEQASTAPPAATGPRPRL